MIALRLAAAGWLIGACCACAQQGTPKKAGATDAPAAACLELRKLGKKAEASNCFQALTRSGNPWHRAEGFWGLGGYQEANEQFKQAVAAMPKNAGVRVRWGRLFYERFNKAEAEQLFDEALEIDPKHAGAQLGMARVAMEGFDQKAVEFARKALEADPKLVEAQELLAWLALEDSNQKKAVEEAALAIQLDANSLDGYAIQAAVDLLNDRTDSAAIKKALEINPRYGRLFATAAHFLVLNRRYEEGIVLYRKALELDADLHDARAELGVNLMRLARDEEARKELELAYDAGYRNAMTTNSLRLMDSYKNFVVKRSGNMVLKLHKKEADLLAVYFEPELKKCIATFEKKYKLKLNQPVVLEVYPDHEDFAVRTLGMPGLGALGVTFGTVVAMDSPSGRKPGTFHWASTLWHEMSHVFVLTATGHRVPRWFTEGLAVHEETAVAPDWGDRLDPLTIEAVAKKRLLPIAELDRGFVRPSYPNQVLVSYFQAGRICDYINRKWGYQTLLDMMHSFGKSMPTVEVVEKHLGMKPEDFDKEFLAWLDQQIGKTVSGVNEWRKQAKAMREALTAKKWDEVIAAGTQYRDVYPEYVEAGSMYEMLAEAYEAKGDKAAAMAQLQRYAQVGGRNPATVKKLAAMQKEAGRAADAAQALARLNFVYLHDEQLHRELGDLLLSVKQPSRAVQEFQALVAMKPLDQASSRYDLARALRQAGRTEEAKEQVLLALEAAPGYKPAQKLLLELNQ